MSGTPFARVDRMFAESPRPVDLAKEEINLKGNIAIFLTTLFNFPGKKFL